MDIVLATNNAHKVLEYKEILKDFDINCLTLADLNIKCDPDETATSFKENSLIKAKEIAKYTNKVVLADDSGLILDAYPNLLGVYSHRFLIDKSYKEKSNEVLRLLKDKNRSARFVCCITLYNFKGEVYQFEGICEGHIANEYVGDNGFGYDPIFIANGYDLTMAQLENSEKNKISHRGLASKKLVEFLKEEMGV